MSKIKILYTGMSSNLGGIEVFLINVYRKIDKEKFDIKFLVERTDKEICFFDEIKDDVIYFTGRKENYFKCMQDLKKIFKENNFDYIHISLMDYSFFERILLAKKYSNSKVILHSHIANSYKLSKKTSLLSFIGKKLIKNKDFILTACSEAAGNYAFKEFKNKEMTIIPNGINCENFIFNKDIREIYRKKLDLKDEELAICHIGRFVTQKNHEFLIDIFKSISAKNKNAKLFLIGEGNLQEEIKQKVNGLGLKEKVIFLGKRDDVNNLLQAFDLLLLPSLFEGLPIVAIEAQSTGLNIVLSDSITKETKINPNVKFVSLSKTAEVWANEVLVFDKNYNRLEYKQNILDSNYNINKSVKNVEKIYLENLRRN